ncbi:MAG: OmpA family protein [Dysgonamonadaceae bacterium]|jgi:outer membrane protein OmpA-like peptidoglycan-associated protein|nr:OmpA family protein [Dysgonamonadaceae bacterium]
MKRNIELLFAVILSVFAFPVIAQEESSLSETVLRNTHYDNWYISTGLSANFLFGEQDRLKSPLDRMKFGGGLSVGKWFNSTTGLSFNIIGGGLRGFNLSAAPFETGYYTTPDDHNYSKEFGGVGHPMGGPVNNGKYKLVNSKDGDPGFWQDFKYGVGTVDLMSNFTNLFRGRAIENSRFDVVGFAGLGLNLAFDNETTTPDFYSLAVRSGLRINLNLTKNFSLYGEGVAYFTDPEFDGYKGTALGDLYANLSIGVQYTFNKRVSSFEKMTIDELDRLNRRVNENRDLIENHQDILERQQKLIEKLGSSGFSEKTVPIIHKEASWVLPEYIRFALDSYQIERSEYFKIQDIANHLKSAPEAKLLLVGYADKQTGNPSYNYHLSKKRVDSVKNELHRSGISDNRLSIEWKGDKEQPFTTNEWNRVVLVIERR